MKSSLIEVVNAALRHGEEHGADVSIHYEHDILDGQGASVSIEIRGAVIEEVGQEGVVRMGITAEEEREYLRKRGAVCPKCGDLSILVDPGGLEVLEGSAHQNCECPACGLEWTDEYTLTSITGIREE